MLFSVVVPVYNVEAYLEDCIRSILNQSHRDFELILVDDGSTDDSGRICDRYAGERVTVLHQENAGHTAARLHGVRQAKGDYIVFSDSDDTLAPDFLEKVHAALETHPADLVQCGMRTVREGRCVATHSLGNWTGFLDAEGIRREILPCLMMDGEGRSFPRSLCAKAMRRQLVLEALEQVPPVIRIGEDMCCVIAMFAHIQSVVFVPEAYYQYRVGHASLSKSGDGMAYVRCRHLLELLKELTWQDPQLLYPQYLRLGVQSAHSATIISLRAEGVCTVRRRFRELLENSELEEILRTARFTGRKMRVKQWLLRGRHFVLIALIDKKNLRKT